MNRRGKKSLKKIDEDYSGKAKTTKKSKGGKVSSGYKCSHNRLY
jgi:hypothetical protein